MTAVVCEGEPDYREVITLICARVGLRADAVADPDALFARLAERECHLVLADAELIGGADGVEELRRRSDAPLISLGSGAPEALLEAGADYHLPKPFSPALLRATVRAALRRSPALVSLARQRIVFGGVVFEPVRRRLLGEGGRLTLTTREADLLEFLALNAGRVVTRMQIIDGAWGGVPEATDAAVVSAVYRLRRKLSAARATARIVTATTLGYRLVLEAVTLRDPLGPALEMRGVEEPRSLVAPEIRP
jgi:DNA-binding response OmpR family regulator